jgi:translation initiation factor 4G
MTPEKFDKISDQILEIAAQSKDESDGRTLRQVSSLFTFTLSISR